MRKLAILIIAVISMTSCSLFEKKQAMPQESIDALVAEKAALEEQVVNLQHDLELQKLKTKEMEQLMAAQEEAKPVSGTYYVIAGSFKSRAYAEEYSAKVKGMGGDGTILDGPYNFNLVSFSAHQSLREASNKMESTRRDVSEDSWIYLLR